MQNNDFSFVPSVYDPRYASVFLIVVLDVKIKRDKDDFFVRRTCHFPLLLERCGVIIFEWMELKINIESNKNLHVRFHLFFSSSFRFFFSKASPCTKAISYLMTHGKWLINLGAYYQLR